MKKQDHRHSLTKEAPQLSFQLTSESKALSSHLPESQLLARCIMRGCHPLTLSSVVSMKTFPAQQIPWKDVLSCSLDPSVALMVSRGELHDGSKGTW